MANPNAVPPKQTQFKPGQSGNPSGRPKNHLDRNKVKRIIDKFLSLSKNELEKLILDKENVPALELMIASTILSCIKAGDYSRMEALLARAIGRVKEEIEDDTPTNPDEEVSKLSMHELLTLVKPVTKDKPE